MKARTPVESQYLSFLRGRQVFRNRCQQRRHALLGFLFRQRSAHAERRAVKHVLGVALRAAETLQIIR